MHNRVGLGTFPLSNVFNEISQAKAERLVKEFIDKGGYFIDTAPIYGTGGVEKLLGRVLKTIPRKKFYLITKTVKHVDEQGRPFISGKYQDVVKQLDSSLLRLNLDYVDLLMVHSPDGNVPAEETLQALKQLKNDGKVRELAVANVTLEELKEYNRTGEIRYVQNRFSLINRSLSADLKKYLLDNRIYLIPYHLLEIGQLTGMAFEKFRLRPGDLRRKLPYWNQKNQQVIFGWVRRYLSPIAKRKGITIGQLNIAWALGQPFIDFVIVGTTKPEYLKINLAADAITLNRNTLSEIEHAYEKLESQISEKYGQSLPEFRGLNEKFY